MAIDVGLNCTYKDLSITGTPNTVVSMDNPANATGTIDYLCSVAHSYDMIAVQFASFSASGNNLTTNGYTGNLGTITKITPVEFNAPGDFTAFNINAGEYIGMAYTGGRADQIGSGGAGIWNSSGTFNIPCSGAAFTVLDVDGIVTVYATGTESAGGVQKSAAGSGTFVGSLTRKLMAKRAVSGVL